MSSKGLLLAADDKFKQLLTNAKGGFRNNPNETVIYKNSINKTLNIRVQAKIPKQP